MQPILAEIEGMLRRELPRLEREFRVSSLALFGSRARQQERADSDLDLLVTFDRMPGLLRFIELEQHLSDLLGMKVDLVLRESLKPAVRERVFADLVTVGAPVARPSSIWPTRPIKPRPLVAGRGGYGRNLKWGTSAVPRDRVPSGWVAAL